MEDFIKSSFPFLAMPSLKPNRNVRQLVCENLCTIAHRERRRDKDCYNAVIAENSVSVGFYSLDLVLDVRVPLTFAILIWI